MTTTSRIFHDQTGKPTAELSMKFIFHQNEECVELNIYGAILSDNAEGFRKFIHEITNYPAQRWRLNLQNLKILSTRGFEALVKLAKKIRKRGHIVEITAVDPIVFYLMRENRIDKYFDFGVQKHRLLESQQTLLNSYCMN